MAKLTAGRISPNIRVEKKINELAESKLLIMDHYLVETSFHETGQFGSRAFSIRVVNVPAAQ